MTTLLPPAGHETWTVDDLEYLPSGTRYEIHNGDLVVMSPARLWHQQIEWKICALLKAAQNHAFTQVGVHRSARDVRVAEIGVFVDEPQDPDAAWHQPSALSLVVEVWSPSSEGKDRDGAWYAECGIPRYWLAEPIVGQRWGALVTMFELAETPSGARSYIKTGQRSLADLEENGLS